MIVFQKIQFYCLRAPDGSKAIADTGHVQTFSFYWENCHFPSRSQKCADIQAFSPRALMADLGEN